MEGFKSLLDPTGLFGISGGGSATGAKPLAAVPAKPVPRAAPDLGLLSPSGGLSPGFRQATTAPSPAQNSAAALVPLVVQALQEFTGGSAQS